MAKEIKLNLDEMAAAGVHLGHRVSKLHPKMKAFVSGIKKLFPWPQTLPKAMARGEKFEEISRLYLRVLNLDSYDVEANFNLGLLYL